jgi:RHS repeat-associated protein
VPTEYTYDSTGLVFSMTSPVMTVFYQYDVRGNRTAVIASGAQAGNETTSYTYDAANRLLTERNPLNQVTTFTYDAVGNRATKLDAKGQLTTYTYDDERRLTDVSFADGTAYAFRFDSLGRRVSEASSTHARTLQYDAVGRVSLVNDGQTGAIIESGYDVEGRRTLVREGGVERRIEYDARGLVKRLALGSSGFINVTHDALGRRTAVTRPNGVRSDWLFDDASQLVSVMHTKGGVVIDGFAYAYDAHGLRTRKTRFDGTFEVYGYDAADRLTRVDDEGGKSSQYVLDGLGNRTALNVAQPGIAALFTTSNSNAFNQLTSSSRSGGGLPSLAPAYVYDANGNLTSETAGSASATYTWDADNRLRQVTQPSLVSSYGYDAHGLRNRKVEGAAETRFLLDGQSVLAEYDSGNVATRRYLQNEEAIDDIYAFAEGGQAYFPLADALGSVVSITDASGAVVRRNNYEAYGARTSTGTGPQWAYGFTGREQDASGWRYHRDRYADASTGRWLQADRLGHVEGVNVYGFAKQSPVMFTDPTGRFTAALNPTLVRSIMIAGTATFIAYSLKLLAIETGSEFDFTRAYLQAARWLSDAFWSTCAMAASVALEEALAEALAAYSNCVANGGAQEACKEVAADQYEFAGGKRSDFYKAWYNKFAGWMFR